MHTTKKNILSICLNPAWQKTLIFARIVPGEVNRAQTLRESGGGKGINLVRALLPAQHRKMAVALFHGGWTGRLLVQELRKAEIEELAVATAGTTRICTTVVDLDSQTVTELIEPSSTITGEEVQSMRQMILERLPDFRGVALCGTLPPGVPGSLYADIADAARQNGIDILLDGIKGATACLEAGVDMLKINASELRLLTGEIGVADAMSACLQRFRINWLGVTDGPNQAFLGSLKGRWQFLLPSLASVVNTTGAGDCASGVMLSQVIQRGGGPIRAETAVNSFHTALACASASCLTEEPSVFEWNQAQKIKTRIAISTL